MDDLLTTRQVQELLQVDRTTIYRMLKDKRLHGVRIGQQWRFPRAEVEALLGKPQPPEHELSPLSPVVLPVHCIQPVQDVFAQIAEVGSLTTAPDGQPLTALSNSCRFCTLIQSSEAGKQACIASWRALAKQSERQPKFVTCHAGLQYARARIEVDGELIAMVIAGQFYDAVPASGDVEARVEWLAQKYGLDRQALADAAKEIPILNEHKSAQIGHWLEMVADTFERVSSERAQFMNKLRSISELSTLSSE